MTGYLPKESPNTKLNKTILRTLWNNKLISKSLGVKNENEAREWFGKNEYAHKKFETWNKDLDKTFKELQKKASAYLSVFKDTRVDKRINNSKKLPASKRPKK